MSLKTPRAYASGAVLPNGEFWITGGASRTKVLKTIEILSVKNDEWRIVEDAFLLYLGFEYQKSYLGYCINKLCKKFFLLTKK